MKKINLAEYGPIISERDTGQQIYNLIKEELQNATSVAVDMSYIKTMATFCAKQIFGNLYLEMGAENFFETVIIKNASDELKMIIQVGIQNAIEESESLNA